VSKRDSGVSVHDRSNIDMEACAWIAQFDGKEPSAQDMEAFTEWLNRSPRHRDAINRWSSLWGDLNVLTEMAVPLNTVKPRDQDRFYFISAFATLLLAFGFWLFTNGINQGSTPPATLYATAVGQKKEVALNDGSKITLNTASQIRVAYSDDQRLIHLLEGEAYFNVTHDPGRPFLVRAADKTVRAVGTAFSVYLRSTDIEVVVTEGVIELAKVQDVVTEDGLGTIEPLNILGTAKHGQRITIGQTVDTVEPITEEEISRDLAWREGMLSFRGEPLEQVVAEVNRYTSMTILISDQKISQLRIGGYFQVGETEAMFEALESSFGVHVDRVNEKLVKLSASR